MKKLFFALFIALAVLGCKKSSSEEGGGGGGTADFSFRNGQNGKLTIVSGSYDAISIEGASVSDLYFVSSDESIVEIVSDGGIPYIYGVAEGKATVTAFLTANPEKFALLEVTVESYVRSIKFGSVYWMQPAETWQDVSHSIIRKRIYRGVELPEAGDAALIGVYSHAGDTANIQAWVDEFQPGHWYYLYCTEDGDSVGLFEDSIQSQRSWLLSTDAYFNGEGEFTVAGKGALFEYTDFYMYDKKYSYCLGGRDLCDDVTAVGTQYVKTGHVKTPYPGYIQVGHFDEDMYLQFFTDYFINDMEVDMDDYPYYDQYGSFFRIYANMVDSETGETYTSGFDFGYPHVSANNEALEDFYLASDETTGWFKMAYYHIEATIFPEYYNYQLATERDDSGALTLVVDETTGKLQLAQTLDLTYQGGDASVFSQAPAKKGVRRQPRNERPVLTKSLNKQMSVSNTIGATLRMVLSTAK